MKILIVDDSVSWREFHKNAIEEIFIELEIEEYEIELASSARQGYDCLMYNNESPYNLIITDLQMEEDFEPKYAGEWFIEQIKSFNQYKKTKVVIISAAYNIQHIAETNNVLYIRKSTARSFPQDYEILTQD